MSFNDGVVFNNTQDLLRISDLFQKTSTNDLRAKQHLFTFINQVANLDLNAELSQQEAELIVRSLELADKQGVHDGQYSLAEVKASRAILIDELLKKDSLARNIYLVLCGREGELEERKEALKGLKKLPPKTIAPIFVKILKQISVANTRPTLNADNQYLRWSIVLSLTENLKAKKITLNEDSRNVLLRIAADKNEEASIVTMVIEAMAQLKKEAIEKVEAKKLKGKEERAELDKIENYYSFRNILTEVAPQVQVAGLQITNLQVIQEVGNLLAKTAGNEAQVLELINIVAGADQLPRLSLSELKQLNEAIESTGSITEAKTALLAKIAENKVYPHCQILLNSQDKEERKQAVDAIYAMGSTDKLQAADVFCYYLANAVVEEEHLVTLYKTLLILGFLRYQEAIPVVRRYLDVEDSFVVKAAVVALEQLGDIASIEKIADVSGKFINDNSEYKDMSKRLRNLRKKEEDQEDEFKDQYKQLRKIGKKLAKTKNKAGYEELQEYLKKQELFLEKYQNRIELDDSEKLIKIAMPIKAQLEIKEKEYFAKGKAEAEEKIAEYREQIKEARASLNKLVSEIRPGELSDHLKQIEDMQAKVDLVEKELADQTTVEGINSSLEPLASIPQEVAEFKERVELAYKPKQIVVASNDEEENQKLLDSSTNSQTEEVVEKEPEDPFKQLKADYIKAGKKYDGDEVSEELYIFYRLEEKYDDIKKDSKHEIVRAFYKKYEKADGISDINGLVDGKADGEIVEDEFKAHLNEESVMASLAGVKSRDDYLTEEAEESGFEAPAYWKKAQEEIKVAREAFEKGRQESACKGTTATTIERLKNELSLAEKYLEVLEKHDDSKAGKVKAQISKYKNQIKNQEEKARLERISNAEREFEDTRKELQKNNPPAEYAKLILPKTEELIKFLVENKTKDPKKLKAEEKVIANYEGKKRLYEGIVQKDEDEKRLAAEQKAVEEKRLAEEEEKNKTAEAKNKEAEEKRKANIDTGKVAYEKAKLKAGSAKPVESAGLVKAAATAYLAILEANNG
ncbi:hypothetical protein ACFL5G_01295, partial [Candidatus Margulisiibacteriota bacterium]